MRINIYKQIRAFYSKVFNNEFDLSPTHISLYMFLLNQNNRTNWSEWFKVPFDTVMHGAAINSNKTYYKALNYLVECGLIEYEKGANSYKAPKISIVPLDQSENNVPAPEDDGENTESSSVTNTPLTTNLLTQLTTNLSKHQCKQLDTQLSTNLSTNKDILLTGNFVITKKETRDANSNNEKKTTPESIYSIQNPTQKKVKEWKDKYGYPEEFEELFNLSDKRQEKLAALTQWVSLTETERGEVKEHWPEYVRLTTGGFQKYFRTYLSNQGWEDSLEDLRNQKGNKKQVTNESEMLEYLYTHRKKENVDLAIQKRGVERVYKDVKEHNMIIDKQGELILL